MAYKRRKNRNGTCNKESEIEYESEFISEEETHIVEKGLDDRLVVSYDVSFLTFTKANSKVLFRLSLTAPLIKSAIKYTFFPITYM